MTSEWWTLTIAFSCIYLHVTYHLVMASHTKNTGGPQIVCASLLYIQISNLKVFWNSINTVHLHRPVGKHFQFVPGAHQYESWTDKWLTWLRFSWFSSVNPGKFLSSILKTVYINFLHIPCTPLCTNIPQIPPLILYYNLGGWLSIIQQRSKWTKNESCNSV